MSEMPERIWAGFDYPVEFGPESFDSKLCMWDIGKTSGDTEYVRADIVEAKDAEIERLKAENDDMRVVMAALGKWRGHMTDKNYVAMCSAHNAYLRDRVASGDNRPPSDVVQNVVQNEAEG